LFKKVSMVTVGIGAGLLVAAPFASAGEAHDPGHGGHGHHGEHHGRGGSDCNVNGGGAEANGGIAGDALLGNVVAQLPVGGNNVGNIVCNDILNDNVSGNHVALSVLGSAATRS
jgi:hypothetical protein